MFTSITSHARALVVAIVVLAGGPVLSGSPAAADPSQDDQFLRLLGQQDIPAIEGASSLIDTAHRVCDKLDGGTPVDELVDTMRNHAYDDDPIARLFPRRITRTMTRFISASVQAYCPNDLGKIASIMPPPPPPPPAANPENGLRERPPASDMISLPAAWREPTGGSGVLVSLVAAVPSGEIITPDPPQIPPPTAQILTPPRAIAAPPPVAKPAPAPPQQAPPPPQQVEPAPEQAPPAPEQVQPPPPQAEPGPQQAQPPAAGPQPGGGATPTEPSPTPPKPPGRVRLAP